MLPGAVDMVVLYAEHAKKAGIERARSIKTGEELKAQRRSAFVCQTALRAMREQTAPDVSETSSGQGAVLQSLTAVPLDPVEQPVPHCAGTAPRR